MRYSVLTFIVGNYEKVHEIWHKHDDVEYILVTDNPRIKSETWTVKLVENPHPEDPFWLCYQIRHNPWEYVSSDIVIKIDGSMMITGDLDPIIEKFNSEHYNLGVVLQPWRYTAVEEYEAWIRYRNYPLMQAKRCIDDMSYMFGEDHLEHFRHLCQYNLMIQRKDDVNEHLNYSTFKRLETLAADGKAVERIDQIIGSLLMCAYENGLEVMPMSLDVCTSGKYFRWCKHGTEIWMKQHPTVEPYLFDEKINYVDL